MLVRTLAVGAAVVMTQAATLVAASPPVLLREIPGGLGDLATDAAVTRRQAIEVDRDVLARLDPVQGGAVTLTLFDGEPVEAMLERMIVRTPSSFTWLGWLAGEPESLVTIVSHDEQVLMNIRAPGRGFLQVRPGVDGGPELQQVEPIDVPACGVGDEEQAVLFRPSLRPVTIPGGGGNVAGGGPCVEDGSVVDVLVVYTTQAAAGAGGAAVMEAQIILAVDETNVAFANSQIPTTIRLADMQEVIYGEYGSSGTDLVRLIEPADGYLDDVHALRDAAAADIVSLITEAGSVCGIARVSVGPGPTPMPEGAFNVVIRSCMGGSELVFAHELGHNFGCLHDWIEDACDAGALLYAKGYIEPAEAFRTVMAYGAAPKIPHFSNPDVLYSGLPTGVPAGQPDPADNALAIMLSAPLVANYRSLDCNGNGLCDADDITSGFSDDVNGNDIPDECEPDCNGNGLPDAHDIAQGAADANANGLPDDCEPAVLFVDAAAAGSGLGASWSDAKPDLQQALAIASMPGTAVQEIWVAAGTYTPGPVPHRAATFRMVNGVEIYGGFAGTETARDERDPAANPTILSGDLAGDDGSDFANIDENAITVLTGSDTDSTAVLDGFVIRGGNADPDFSGCWFSPYNAGGGIRIFGGSPTIRNCKVTGNSVTGDGGGVYIVHTSNPVFDDCTIEANQAVASSPGNPGAGAGVGVGTGTQSARFIRCRFIDNVSGGTGGAVFDRGFDTSYVNCVFQGNTAAMTGGGVRVTKNNTQLTSFVNCVFTGNTAGNVGGGQFYSYGAGVQDLTYSFTNCSFVGNSAANIGGLSPAWWDIPVLTNCIVWGNTDNYTSVQDAQIEFGFPVINHTTIEGWNGTLGGVGNDGLDPAFADADGPDDTFGTVDDDVRLTTGSPSIDTADDAALPTDDSDLDDDGDTAEALPLDLDGAERVSDGDGDAVPQVDRGAYEVQGGTLCPADLDGDGSVSTADLLALLASWGSCADCPPDLNGDGFVDTVDLLALLSAWGPCG